MRVTLPGTIAMLAVAVLGRPAEAQRLVIDDVPVQQHFAQEGATYVALEALLRAMKFDWSLADGELALRDGAGRGPAIAAGDLTIKLGDRTIEIMPLRRPDGAYVPLHAVAPHLGFRAVRDPVTGGVNVVRVRKRPTDRIRIAREPARAAAPDRIRIAPAAAQAPERIRIARRPQQQPEPVRAEPPGRIQIERPVAVPVPLPVPSAGTGESLLFGTYNVQALPATNGNADKAYRQAQRIAASGYDLIVLTEVFSEDARPVFVDVLKNLYPYRVEYLGGPTVAAEDSGLMLFSKLPFEPLPNATYLADPSYCEGTHCDRVAFLIFDSCYGSLTNIVSAFNSYPGADCLAEKGVGVVRLRNPATGRILNVAFTHMQASYPPPSYPTDKADIGDAKSEAAVRVEQLKDVERVLCVTVTGTPTCPVSPVESFFLLGDLNIDGNLANPLGAWDYVNQQIRWEWVYRLGPNANPPLFKQVLVDPWAASNTPNPAPGPYDLGLTNMFHWGASTQPGARLDFILKSRHDRLCAQHMTIARNLWWSPPGGTFVEGGLGPKGVGIGGVDELSDHYGINLDLNRDAPECSPATARVFDAPQPGAPITASGDIGWPGRIRWLRFDRSGTWSFDLKGADGVEFRVYQGSDLSTPAPQYKEEVTSLTLPGTVPVQFDGKKYRIPEAPFFVRIYHPERTGTGTYHLTALLHDCASKELSCALAPGQALEHLMPQNAPLTGADEAWFHLYSENVPHGRAQELFFEMRRVPNEASFNFQFEVRDKDGNLLDLESKLDEDETSFEDPQCWPYATGCHFRRYADRTAEAKKYFLVVRRLEGGGIQPPYQQFMQRIVVRWTTDLSILYGSKDGGPPVRLWVEEVNDFGINVSDEIYIGPVERDGQVIISGAKHLADLKEGMSAALDSPLSLPIYFLDRILLKGFDEDDLSGNDHFQGSLLALQRGAGSATQRRLVLRPENGGKYVVLYNLTRGFDR